jgi:hypothetical protein
MYKAQDKILKQALVTQQQINDKHMRPDGPLTTFAIDSFVLEEYPDGAMGKRAPTKLHPILRGPFRVINIQGNKYTVEDLVSGKRHDVDIHRLQGFKYDPERTNPVEVARRDTDEFVIEDSAASFAKKKIALRESIDKFIQERTGFHSFCVCLNCKTENGNRLRGKLNYFVLFHDR